jgi:hypothetical protein
MMSKTRLRFAAALLVLGLPATHASADDPPRLSVAEFDRLFQQLHVKNQPWAGLPWKTSVTEARRLAAREKKPIFFNVNTGDALGFV